MKNFTILAGLAALVLTSATAQADHRWRFRKFMPWENQIIYLDEGDDDVAYYEEDDGEEVIYLSRRKRQMREAEQQVERDIWWLDNGAQRKLEKRKKAIAPVTKKVARKVTPKKPVVAKQVVVAKPKPTLKPASDPIVTASLAKPIAPAKPKTIAKPPAPVAASKTIGCTAGAAVITGYGFADVKPKACTGTSYAYTAVRAGKNYQIMLAAASGEITDVQKLN